MNIEDILNIDYRQEKGKREIQEALFSIPPIERNCDKEKIVTMEAVEKVISVISARYNIEMGKIKPTLIPYNSGMIYKAYVKENQGNFIKIIYGCCIYELLSKAAIYMYDEIKKGKVLEGDVDG